MLNFKINKKVLDNSKAYCKNKGIIIPTFEQMKNPEKIPSAIKKELKNIGLWDVHPKNLFRITWKNQQKDFGGEFGNVNYMQIPTKLTGVKANIIGLCGKWFPTGAHKVGATFGCIIPQLVTGQFDPTTQHAVWPSTGNFCRGGAYVSALLGCNSIAILPKGMSKERFKWLSKIAGKVIATPGCESNVKEIFDKCWELKNTRNDVTIFNQFEELGNTMWHYNVTGSAMEEAFNKESKGNANFAGVVLSSGSAGTLGSAYYIKDKFLKAKMAVSEALQCPTLLNNGFGDHRIEGIGDKHVPWIHDVKNTDMVIAIDDEIPLRILRLFNEQAGKRFLKKQGISNSIVERLNFLGISGISNLLSAIKFSKYYELTENDYVFTVFTDSVDLYGSRLAELDKEYGKYSEKEAAVDFEILTHQGLDNLLELSYNDRKRIHNLKYYTWIEQQGKKLGELNDQWYEHNNYWGKFDKLAKKLDELILDFNN